MTSTIKVNTIQDAGGRVHETFSFVCRFTMITTSATVGTTVNTSSITDNGTGDYTINFSSSFADTNYCMVSHAYRNGSSGGRVLCHTDVFNTITTSSVRFNVSGTNNAQVVGLSNVDVDHVHWSFFND